MKGAGGVSQVVEPLPSKCEVLNSISSTVERERRGEQEREKGRVREKEREREICMSNDCGNFY
jgi:hypothetical protein